MRMVERACCLVALLMFFGTHPANATWSIVAVDPETGEVGGASATCTPWASAIIGVVPGKGIIVTQAASNILARYRGEALLMEGLSPEKIIAAITDYHFDPTHAIQQHGIAALGFEKDAAGYTGADTGQVRGDLQGKGVSVQGNILTGKDVLSAALDAFQVASQNMSFTLADRLLLALEAGAAMGGDRRCGNQTALSAYLVVARPDDSPKTPSIRITAPPQIRGGRNAVELLRELYNQTVRQ